MVEGRHCDWELLTKDVPEDKNRDLDYIVEQLDWEFNTDTHFGEKTYLEPINLKGSDENYTDRWIVYGTVHGKQVVSARELTVNPGAKVTIKDEGGYGLITVQGTGKIASHEMESPSMIRYGEMTKDEFFVSHEAATQGVTFENTGNETLVTLRYFGPDTWSNMPNVGDHRN